MLIIGDHGVGKTALIEGFVQKVLLKQIPDILSGLEIFELDMGALVAGASYKGEIEDRIKNIALEIYSNHQYLDKRLIQGLKPFLEPYLIVHSSSMNIKHQKS